MSAQNRGYEISERLSGSRTGFGEQHATTIALLLYAGFVRLDNGSRASYNFATNPYTEGSLTGLDLNGFVLGTAHFF